MRRLGALAVGAVLLSGCTGLPSETVIQTGKPVGGVVNDVIRVAAQGPVPRADAQDVVAGFLRASVAVDDDPTVAEEFLTSTGAAEWDPKGVVIFENGVQPTVTVTGTKAHVAVPVTGALDAEGHYRDLPAGSRSTLDLTLDKGSGEWRIARGLKTFGVMMSRGDFARYGSYAITYSAAGEDVAVDDDRWFLRGPGLETRLARAVLETPPGYLQGAVVGGVPEYTELVGAVSVADGVATVDLSERAATADARARRLLWARMTRVLEQADAVERVQITAGGTRLAVDGLPDRPLSSADVPLTTPTLRADVAVTRVGEVLTAIAPGTLGTGAPGPSSTSVTLPRLPASWYKIALAADSTELAAIGGDDAELARWRGTRSVRVTRFATSLSRPAYDRQGILWLAGHTPQGTRVFVLDTPAAGLEPTAPTPLNIPWLSGRRVRAVEVAADGTRLAVVSTGPEGGAARIDVAGIVRKGSMPVGLATPRTVAGDVADLVDVTWADESTLAVIGRATTTVPLRVVTVPLNDSTSALGEVPRGTAITSYGGVRSIVVVTSDHRVLLRSGGTFVKQLDSREFALPGR